MKTTKIKLLLTISLVIFTSFLFSSCGKKNKNTPNAQPTPAPKILELEDKDKPYVGLIPRQDGHELKLIISNLPSFVDQIEYELIYLAVDGNLEIEKGVGDTIKVTSASLERDLLLGTASCTNGCKYKYDTGVTGGTLSISFITTDNQVASYKSDFSLVSSSAQKTLSLTNGDFSVTATPKSTEFFVLLKNFGTKDQSSVSSIYSVFSSLKGDGKLTSVNPSSAAKDNMNTISGDYLIK